MYLALDRASIFLIFWSMSLIASVKSSMGTILWTACSKKFLFCSFMVVSNSDIFSSNKMSLLDIFCKVEGVTCVSSNFESLTLIKLIVSLNSCRGIISIIFSLKD